MATPDPIIDDAIVHDGGDSLVHDGPQADWQAGLKDVTLDGGFKSKLRQDGHVYLPKGNGADGAGWYRPNVYDKTGWTKGPDAPADFTPNAVPGKQGDAEIATNLLHMTPEQFMNIASSPDYRPGMLAKGFDDPNSFMSQYTGTIGKSLLGGLRSGVNGIAQLMAKPASWTGDTRTEELYKALGKINQMNQNLNQGRSVQQNGGMLTDPLYSGAKVIPGMILTDGLIKGGGPVEGTTQAVDQTLGKEALQQVGKKFAVPGFKQVGTTTGAYAARASAEVPTNAGAAFLTTPGDLKDRAQAATTAAVATPIVHSISESIVAPGLQKFINFATNRTLPAGASEVSDLGDQFGVRTKASDLVEDPASKVTALGKVQTGAPIGGLGAENTAQQAESQVAAQKLLGGLKKKMNSLGYSSPELLSQAAASGDKRAMALVQAATEAGEDPGKVIQADGNINLFMAQSRVNRAFDRARSMDTGAVGTADHLAPMNAAVDEELAKANAVGEANKNKPLIDYLQKVKRDINGPAVDEATVSTNGSGDSAASQEAINRVASEQAKNQPRYMVNLRTGQATPMPATVDAVDQLALPHTAIMQKGIGKDPSAWTVLDHNSKLPQYEIDAAMPRISAQLDTMEGAKPQAAAPATSDFVPTYSNLADYRKGIQAKRQAVGTPASELTGNDATAALKHVQSGTEEAMGNVAELSPGVSTADKYARQLHLDTVVPFKDKAIINELSSLAPDKIANRFSTMTPDEVAHATSILGEKGKAAARLNMIDRAVQGSMDRTQPADYQFQPLEFAKKLTNPQFQESLGLTVPKGGEGKWTVDGFTKLMQHLQLAGEVGAPTLTFSQRMLSEPSVLTKWMLTTPRGKSLLLSASDLKAGSPAMAKVVEKIEQALPVAAGTATSMEN